MKFPSLAHSSAISGSIGVHGYVVVLAIPGLRVVDPHRHSGAPARRFRDWIGLHLHYGQASTFGHPARGKELDSRYSESNPWRGSIALTIGSRSSACLNAPTGGGSNGGPSSGPSGPGGPPGSGAAGGSSGRGGGGRNNVGGINIGGGAGGGDPGVTGHGGPAGHQHAAGGPPPLESSEGPLDSGSSPTTPFHGGYGGSQYAGGRSMTASSTTAASNSSPALTHASPSLGGETGKRARRRTEIAQKDVSMGVPVGGPPSLRRATLPASTADAAAALEAEAMPNGHPAAATPEYAGEHPTPPTGAPPMSRSYSSSGPGDTGNDSPGPMYHAAPGGGPDGWNAHSHYPAHDVGHHGHHQAPYGHGMPAHPPMPMQTAVVQQGWGDFGGRR